jgi:hypothetical protein
VYYIGPDPARVGRDPGRDHAKTPDFGELGLERRDGRPTTLHGIYFLLHEMIHQPWSTLVLAPGQGESSSKG